MMPDQMRRCSGARIPTTSKLSPGASKVPTTPVTWSAFVREISVYVLNNDNEQYCSYRRLETLEDFREAKIPEEIGILSRAPSFTSLNKLTPKFQPFADNVPDCGITLKWKSKAR